VNATKSLQKYRAENEQLREKVAQLNEQIEWFKQQIFGSKSEKIVDDTSQTELFLPFYEELSQNEEVTQTETIVPSHKRRKNKSNGKNKLSFPEDLPIERNVLDITDKDKEEQNLVRIGEEVSQKLAYKPGSYFIRETVRPKYAVSKHEEKGIIIAELPDSIIPRCRADESFLAHIITRKFADHLPFYRQNEICLRDDVFVSRQLMSQWVIQIGQALKPLHDLMLEEILKNNNVHIDETPVSLQIKGKGKTHQAFMWVLVGGGGTSDPPYRYFDFQTNRKHEHAEKYFKGYRGIFHSDKFGGYESVAKKEDLTWCPCWAHIRRYFLEGMTGDSEFRSWVLRKIKYLFMLERVAWARSPEERLRIRQEKAVPIIDELIEAIKQKLIEGHFPKRSKFRLALGYFVSLIPYLKNYTKHPMARLDNNIAERAIRPLAIGRKNWLFMGSKNGGESAAVLISLVQTCRNLDINPQEYLEDIMRRIMSHSTHKLHELLPDNWLASRQTSQ